MAQPTRTELITLALRARGYSELAVREPLASSARKFRISPTHARRLDPNASIVELGDGGAIRLGRVPMPRAMRESLASEGQAIHAKAERLAMTCSLEDLGL